MVFVINSILLGIGLAMDAFSVSVSNGLREPKMKLGKLFLIAAVFGIFQGVMPMLGWGIVTVAVSKLVFLSAIVPWIAVAVLLFLGIKMIIEGLSSKKEEDGSKALTLGFGTLMLQGIATSIDALSVGLTIADYEVMYAVICAVIIAVVTFLISAVGVLVGIKIGKIATNKAPLIGGAILIIIAIEIFVKIII